MGLFGIFRAKETPPPEPPKPEAKDLGPVLMEIARIISSGDEAVLRDITACTEDPASWFTAHQNRYEERGVDSVGDLDLVQWLGLVDILEEHGWVCERDWKDEHRDIAPLKQAEDAVLLDTTGLNLEQSCDRLLSLVKEKIAL